MKAFHPIRRSEHVWSRACTQSINWSSTFDIDVVASIDEAISEPHHVPGATVAPRGRPVPTLLNFSLCFSPAARAIGPLSAPATIAAPSVGDAVSSSQASAESARGALRLAITSEGPARAHVRYQNSDPRPSSPSLRALIWAIGNDQLTTRLLVSQERILRACLGRWAAAWPRLAPTTSANVCQRQPLS